MKYTIRLRYWLLLFVLLRLFEVFTWSWGYVALGAFLTWFAVDVALYCLVFLVATPIGLLVRFFRKEFRLTIHEQQHGK